jgi:DNA-binding transcriptional LysR family regulator
VSGTAWNESLAGLTRQDVRESIEATVEVDNCELLASVVASTDAILIASERDVPGLAELAVNLPDREWYRSEVGFFTLRGRTLSPAAEAIGSILRDLAVREGVTQPEP